MCENDSSQPPGGTAEFYRLLVEHAAVAMVAMDRDYRVVAWNAAAEKVLGKPAAEMIGGSILKIVPPDRVALLKRLLARTAERRTTSRLDLRMPAGDGPSKDLTVLLSPIAAADGTVHGTAAWVIDETARTKLTERLAQAEKFASLGTLAGGVAHHFNNILGGVATFVDYALTSGGPVAMKRALQMTAEAAARASKITQSLLSFAKADTHEADMADLTEVVLTFVHLVERPLAERDIKLNLDLRPVPVIAVEANRMHQVLGNLLTNAEEAMPEGGHLSISLSRDEKHVTLKFADTGCGVKKEHLPLIFEPFFTTKGLLAGGSRVNPGLGLSVAHGMVVEMGGTIEADSEAGKGTTFTLTFPIPPPGES